MVAQFVVRKRDIPRRDGPQVLFWNKVEIVPPPKPRRKVKKYRALLKYRKKDEPIRFEISNGLYATLEEARHRCFGAYEALCLIPETEQEFDE